MAESEDNSLSNIVLVLLLLYNSIIIEAEYYAIFNHSYI